MTESETIRILEEFLSYKYFKMESSPHGGCVYSIGDSIEDDKFDASPYPVDEGLWRAANYFRAKRLAEKLLIELLDKERLRIINKTK